ncbi:MAG: L,D-transpeptidase family protein [Bacillota bacterium]|nr:L,D-transpeptidase family protein [Bacillota bacterium]
MLICVISLALSMSPVYGAEPANSAPELISVVTENQYRSITVNWQDEAYADGHEIYLKPANKPKRIIQTDAVDEQTITGLARNRKYTVKVRSFVYGEEDGACIYSPWSRSRTVRTEYTDWQIYLDKYEADDSVNELILLKYKGGSRGTLVLYQKDETGCWQELLKCKAYTGKRGINKKKQGDRKTPKGDYALTCAFGIKSDPGSAMKYTKITKYHYWCADKYYNRMVDVRKQKHKCHGEHLIKYMKQYAYAMNIGYNLSGRKGKGSALFLHCFGNYRYTLGCVAVEKANMKKIIQTCGEGSRICIYRR